MAKFDRAKARDLVKAGAKELVVAEFTGGDVDRLNSRSPVVWLDLDRGTRFRGESWAALTTREHVDSLLAATAADLCAVNAWDGEAFGDGNCGTVTLDGTTIRHGSIKPTFVPAGYKLAREE